MDNIDIAFKHNVILNAYLMVEFDTKTQLPVSIDIYSESEHEITMIGNEYVKIASMKWHVADQKRKHHHGTLFDILQKQYDDHIYDECVITYKCKNWTVLDCKKFISK